MAPIFAPKEIVTRFSIVVVTLAAGVGLALWMMPGRAPPPPTPVKAAPPLYPLAAPPAPIPAPAPAPTVPPLPLRPRVAPAPLPAAPPPKAEAARPAHAKPAPPKVIVVVRPPPAKAPGCEASDSRAEMLICANPALAAAERDDQRAARRAAAAGRRTNPAEWLAIREAAARQGPQALAEAYRRHTSALNRLAEPPH